MKNIYIIVPIIIFILLILIAYVIYLISNNKKNDTSLIDTIPHEDNQITNSSTQSSTENTNTDENVNDNENENENANDNNQTIVININNADSEDEDDKYTIQQSTKIIPPVAKMLDTLSPEQIKVLEKIQSHKIKYIRFFAFYKFCKHPGVSYIELFDGNNQLIKMDNVILTGEASQDNLDNILDPDNDTCWDQESTLYKYNYMDIILPQEKVISRAKIYYCSSRKLNENMSGWSISFLNSSRRAIYRKILHKPDTITEIKLPTTDPHYRIYQLPCKSMNVRGMKIWRTKNENWSLLISCIYLFDKYGHPYLKSRDGWEVKLFNEEESKMGGDEDVLKNVNNNAYENWAWAFGTTGYHINFNKNIELGYIAIKGSYKNSEHLPGATFQLFNDRNETIFSRQLEITEFNSLYFIPIL